MGRMARHHQQCHAVLHHGRPSVQTLFGGHPPRHRLATASGGSSAVRVQVPSACRCSSYDGQ